MLSVFLMFAVIVVGQTKPKAAPVKPSGKYAVLQLPAYNEVCGFAETNSTLYINSGDNVFAVDKVTGETKVVLKSEDDTNHFSGKILGIATVALTQIAIWAVLVIAASKFLIPALFSADIAATSDMMLQGVMGTLGDTGYITMLFAYLALFILGGFLLYEGGA